MSPSPEPVRSAEGRLGVSVVVGCYNFESYIARALDSVYCQNIEDLQIIVVDDCSTDRSFEVLQGWVASHPGDVTLIRQPENSGLTKALNRGLALATRPYFSQLDGDDVLAPGILRAHCEILDDEPAVGVVYGDVQYTSPDLSEDGGRYLTFQPFQGDILIPLIQHGGVLPVIGTVIRTDLMRSVGGYDEWASYQDWPLLLKLAQKTEFRCSGLLAGQFPRPPNSMSRTHAIEMRATRLEALQRLWMSHLTTDARSAAKARARSVALSMWTHGDGRAGARTCRRYVAKRFDIFVALVGAVMFLRIPAILFRAPIRRIKPGWWR